MAVSIHLVLPADLVMSPRGLAGPLPARHPQPDPLGPKKKRDAEAEYRFKASSCDHKHTQRLLNSSKWTITFIRFLNY